MTCAILPGHSWSLSLIHIFSRLLEQMGSYDMATARDISVIAMFHDIGAYKTDEISRMLEFETSNVQNHSAYGNLFIKYFTPLTRLAPAVLFHHTPWCILKNMNEVSEENKIVAQLLNIADRADIFMEKERKSFPEFVQLLKADGGKDVYKRQTVQGNSLPIM